MTTNTLGATPLQPSQTALLVIDLQNDFCSPDGYLAKCRGYNVSYVNDVLANIRRLLEVARTHGMHVVWVRSRYDFKYINEVFQDKRGEEGCCIEGTWGADFYEEQPAQDDVVVDKHTFSAFYETNLEEALRQRGIKNLVLSGVATNVCVDSTLRDGFFRGYRIVLVEDAVGSNSKAGHEGTLATVRNNIGTVATTSDVAEWFQERQVEARPA